MPSTTPIRNNDAIAARLREAVESERYEDALPLLIEYSDCVAGMYQSGDPAAPPEQEVMELVQWAYRTLTVARAHASDQFQLLANSRVYASPDADRKTWQIMV